MCIQVAAPSRLHFGLFAFQSAVRSWGGMGLMLRRPRVLLQATPASMLSATGPSCERVLEFARLWLRQRGPAARLAKFDVLESLPSHRGLGSGTALALSVATAMDRLIGREAVGAADLAQSVHRGRRSAVGAHGFRHGGLIMELGRAAGESLAPLTRRVEIPDNWRFVLLRPSVAAGLSGAREQRAFDTLAPIAPDTTKRLIEMSQAVMAAAAGKRFAEFSEGLYQFGRSAGECFSAVQNGPYNGDRLHRLVAAVRKAGCAGVGQSSWGPTLFAAAPHVDAAQQLVARLRASGELAGVETEIAAPCNSGARVSHVPQEAL